MATYQRDRQAPLQIEVHPSDSTRLGRMLQGGRLTATMRSKRTGEHITLTLHAMKKDEKWEHVPFEEATHVFIKLGDGSYGSTTLATYYPPKGALYYSTDDAGYKYAALNTLLASESGNLDTQAFLLQEEERCGVCGRPLTDPISIERGIGPTCIGNITGSVHYHAQPKAPAPTPAPAPTDRKGREVPKTFEALALAARA